MSNLKAMQERSKQSATAARESAKRQAHPWRMKGAVFVGSLVFLASLSSWWKQYREESASRETPPAQEAQARMNAPAQQVQDVPVVNGFRDFRLTLSETEWSEPVNVLHTECIEWGRTNPDMPAVLVEARSMAGPWMGWDEYQRRRDSGKHGDPAWFRFKAESPNQGVWYKIGVRDTCS